MKATSSVVFVDHRSQRIPTRRRISHLTPPTNSIVFFASRSVPAFGDDADPPNPAIAFNGALSDIRTMVASEESALDVPFDLVREACGSIIAAVSDSDAPGGERGGGGSASISESPENQGGTEHGTGAQLFPPGVDAGDAAVEEGISGNADMSVDLDHNGYDSDDGPNNAAQQHDGLSLGLSHGAIGSKELKEREGMDEAFSEKKKIEGDSTRTSLSTAEGTDSQSGIIGSTQMGSVTKIHGSDSGVLQSLLAPPAMTNPVEPQRPHTDVPDGSSRSDCSSTSARTEGYDPLSLSSSTTDGPQTAVDENITRNVSTDGNAGASASGIEAGGGHIPAKATVLELAASNMNTGQAVIPTEGGTDETVGDTTSIADDMLKHAGEDAVVGRQSSISLSSKSSEGLASMNSSDPDSAAAGISGELPHLPASVSGNGDQVNGGLNPDAPREESPAQGTGVVVEESNLVNSVPSISSIESREGGLTTTETANDDENSHRSLTKALKPPDEDDEDLDYDLDSFGEGSGNGDLLSVAADSRSTEAGIETSRHSAGEGEDNTAPAVHLSSNVDYDSDSDFGDDGGDGSLPAVAVDPSSCFRAPRVGTEAGNEKSLHIDGEVEDDIGSPGPAERLPSKVYQHSLENECRDDSGDAVLLMAAAGPSSAGTPNLGTTEANENSGCIDNGNEDDTESPGPAEPLHSNSVAVEPEVVYATVDDDSDYPSDVDKVDEDDGNYQSSSGGSTLYDYDDDDGHSHSSGSTLGTSGRSSSGNSTEGEENSSNSSAGASHSSSAGEFSSGSESGNLSISDSADDGESAQDGSTSSLQAPQAPPGVDGVSSPPAGGKAADAASDQDNDDDYSLGSSEEPANHSYLERTSTTVESTEAVALFSGSKPSQEYGSRSTHDGNGGDPPVILAPETSAATTPGPPGLGSVETTSEAVTAAAERESQHEAQPATTSKGAASNALATEGGDCVSEILSDVAGDTHDGDSISIGYNERSPVGSETVEPAVAGGDNTYKPNLDEIGTSANAGDLQNLMLRSSLSSSPDVFVAGESPSAGPHHAPDPPEASAYDLPVDEEEPKLSSQPPVQEHLGEIGGNTVAQARYVRTNIFWHFTVVALQTTVHLFTIRRLQF